MLLPVVAVRIQAVFRSSKRISDLETRVATLALAVADLRADHAATLPASMLELIQSIQTDLELTRASLRSVHGKVAIQKRLEPGNSQGANDVPTDEEFSKMLEMQRAFSNGGG